MVGTVFSRKFGVGLLTAALVLAQSASFLPFLDHLVPAGASAANFAGRIYVGNETDGTVSVVELIDGVYVTVATVDVGGTPYGVTVRPGGTQVWVADYAGGKVDAIDVATNTIVTTATVVGNPHSVAFNSSGTLMYVTVPQSTNPLADDTVWVFDATVSPPYPMATIPVGADPAGITTRPDGKRLYVADYGSNTGDTVTVIDIDPGSGTQNTVVATVTVGTGPFSVAFQPDSSRAYVANRGSDDVTVIDTATNAVVTTIAAGGGSIFVAVNRAGTRAFVTNIDDDSVSVIDTTTNTVATTWDNVGLSPRGIALNLDDSIAYIASSSNDEVAVIETTGTYLNTIGVGTQPFYVAVIPDVTQISGIAECPNEIEGTTLLPGATVELFSGSALLATTIADLRTAEYGFIGVAPNATYTLRYTKTFFVEPRAITVTCSTTVTTDGSGNGTGGVGTGVNNRHNHTWVTAFQIASGSPITDFVFEEGQSTWFKIPITRGQRVTVKLTNVPADLSLALYKDIKQIFDAEIAALAGTDPLQTVRDHDASVAPDALSPDALSPDELSPDELSPDALSPDALSPDELSPDELSPDELSPDELSPDALSPDALSPDELSAAYSGAQTAALIGVSAHVGLSPEQISRNTWDNTGYFYMRVRGHNGAYNATAPFTIEATAIDNQCGPVSLVDYPQSPTVTGTGALTLVLTNSARFPGGVGADVLAKANEPTFRDRLDVKAIVVDLATPLAAAYTQWDTHKACPSAANIVAHSIKDIIRAYATANPSLRYVTLLGNDSVVPFFRQPDQSGLGSEKDYFPSVLDTTASQASLRLGYVLTQDFYGSLRPISRFDHELYLPDLAVGRVGETSSQIAAMIDAFKATNGTVAPTRALVAGYDFLSDAAGFIADQLQANALTVDRALIQPVGDGPTAPTAWTGDQLKAKLFGTTTFGILSLNAHFSANTLLAADYATRVRTSDIAALPASDARFRNALILSTGCHSGYGIVDGDQTALTDPMDWWQVLAARGATLVGGTGYQYGDTDFMKYSEQLLANTTLELRYGTGGVPIGVALANAKRTYVSKLPTLGGIDEKAVAEATLYGLPMLKYDLPAGSRLVRPTPTAIGALLPGTSAGLSFADLPLTNALTQNLRTLQVVGGGTQTAIYYDLLGMIAVQPGQPVLPLRTLDAAKTGQVVRGAVLLDATYADQVNVVPFTDVATADVRGVHPRYQTDVFTPVRPFDLNHFSGETFVSTPFQFRSDPGETNGTARRFLTQDFRLYYSSLADARALAAAPTVYHVDLVPDGAGNVDVTVIVGGLLSVGIEEVFATFTGESGPLHGSWTSTAPLAGLSDVSRDDAFARTYTGSIPLGGSDPDDLRVVIQAVGGNGLVTWASNDGAYYRVVDETATVAAPKVATALSLTVPATGVYRTSIPVSAVLTAAGEPLANKPVAFRSGGIRVNAVTNGSGVASTNLFLTSAPGPALVTVGFAEEQEYLASGAEAPITVMKAPTTLVAFDTVPFPTGGSVLLATLRASLTGETLPLQPVTLSGGGRTVQTYTDGFGRVRLDSTDGFPTGAYSVTIAYAGNDRYLAAATATVLIVQFDTTTSVTAGGWFTTSNSLNLADGNKANFGASLKYKQGTIVPVGNLELQLNEANLTLKATSFDWLAIGSGRADATGRATINGQAGWSFHATLFDGPDRFAIVVWNDTTGSEASPAYKTGGALGGGSISIH